jgi:ArsR family transcriptional regulator
MKKIVKVMKALSDPNRLRIMKILSTRTMCVCELQYSLSLAQSSISKHLKILEEADLVTSSKDGLWVNYSLTRSPENPYAEDMLKTLESWLEGDKGFEDVMFRAMTADRRELTKG